MNNEQGNNNDSIKKIFEAPAKILEQGVEFVEKEEKILFSNKPVKLAKEYWGNLGPGLISGAADDDPSGIATYSQAGASYGHGFLWLSWFTFPLMAVIQEMCARIGFVTGHGLAANIRRHFPKSALYLVTILLFVANTFNIGADLGAMAQGVQLIFPKAEFAFLVIGFGVVCVLLQIFVSYATYAKYLKYLAFVLIAYIFSALLSEADWGAVIRSTFSPAISFSKDYLLILCGIFGTTISPYLFFWQTSQEVEEKNLAGQERPASWHQKIEKSDIRKIKADVWSGMFFSNLVMFFIISACSNTLFVNGITNIATASDAAMALRPFAGDFAYYLFAIGIIGTGMLAIPVLAGSTSYAISESFGFKQGLSKKLKQAYAFYGVIIVSVFIGILLNFVGLDPIKALLYSAIANGIIAPVIIVFIILLAGSNKIMGEFVAKKSNRYIAWGTVAIMSACGITTLLYIFS